MSDDLMHRLRDVGELNDSWSAEQLTATPTPAYLIGDLQPARQTRKLIPAAIAAVVLVAVIAAGVVIAGMSSDDPTEVRLADERPGTSLPAVESDESGPPAEPSADEAAAAAEFCARFNSLPEEVEESFIGSDEHIAWADSNLIENYPPEIQSAVLSLETYVADTC